MIEFAKHLEFYDNYWFGDFSKNISEPNWGNKEIAEIYLQKYWLAEDEYLRIWKPIQDDIFFQDKNLPELVYKAGFDMMALRGGCLFVEADFKQLKGVLQDIGEEYFVVIQHSQDFTESEPMFRMKFPVSITWEELTSGNYISAVLLEMSLNEYFVFGTKGNWAKYAANDYKNPLDILGFKPEIGAVFQNHFKQSKEEQEKIYTWLPEEYQKRIEN